MKKFIKACENCGVRGWGWCPDFKAEFGTQPWNKIEEKFMAYKQKELDEADYVRVQPLS